MQQYVSQFYTANNLLCLPKIQKRHEAWDSHKRLLLKQDANDDQNHDGNNQDDNDINNDTDDGDNNDDDKDGDDGNNDSDEYQNGGQEELEDGDDEDGKRKDTFTAERKGTRKRKVGGQPGLKGKYKKRDMYGAIDGEGLLALGMSHRHPQDVETGWIYSAGIGADRSIFR